MVVVVAAIAWVLGYRSGEAAGWCKSEAYYRPILDRQRDDVRSGTARDFGHNIVDRPSSRGFYPDPGLPPQRPHNMMPSDMVIGVNTVDPSKVPAGKPGDIFNPSSGKER